jgi:hypothetical protein
MRRASGLTTSGAPRISAHCRSRAARICAPPSLIARGLASTRLLPLPDFDDLSRLVIRHSLRPVLCGLTADVRVVDDVPPEAGGKYRIVKALVSDHRSRG